jgi:hypothetical protein
MLLAGTMSLVALGACGGGDSGGPDGGSSGLTARVDGVRWEAEPISIAASAVAGVPGGLLVLGTETSGGITRSVIVTLYNVRGPGTYALGVGSEVYGGTGQVGEGTGNGGDANSWITENTGDAGSVTITTLSGGRIKGTFAFVADTGHNNTTAETRTVTDGEFDLPFTGTLVPVPANKGSKVSAEYGSRFYNAWSVNGLLQDLTGGPGFQFSTSTKYDGLSIHLQAVTDTGTFSLSSVAPIRVITAGHNGGDASHCCWGGGGSVLPSTGTIKVTSISATRVQGTFNGILQPQTGKPATTPLVITDGTFDVGIP